MEVSSLVQIVTTVTIGIIGFFVRSSMNEIKGGIKNNGDKIEDLEKKQQKDCDKLQRELNELKSDLPLVYTLREDFIRTLNNVENKMTIIEGKIDKLLQSK